MASRNIGASEEDLAALHKTVAAKLAAIVKGTWVPTREEMQGLKMSLSLLKDSEIECTTSKPSSGLSIKEPLPFPTDDDLDEAQEG